MPQVKTLTWLIWEGREVPPGELLDVSDALAESLVARGKAERPRAAEPKPAAKRAAKRKPAASDSDEE